MASPTPDRRPLRLAATVVGVLVAVALVVVLAGGSDAQPRHRVAVVVDQATNVIPGAYVRSAGSIVGEVTEIAPVDRGRRARVELELDDAVWPLPGGSTMQLRWGGTANYSNRYIDLQLGRDRARPMARDGRFPTTAMTTPVDFDQMLQVFDRRTRRDLRGLLDTGGPTLDRARRGLRGTLERGPGALEQLDAVLGDLDAERHKVRTLVRSADQVLGAVDAAEPGLRPLLAGAAQTFDAVAAEAGSLEQTLERAPGVLTATRRTLARADDTLELAEAVTRDVAGGVTRLRRITPPVDETLRHVVDLGPDAKATLRTARRATKDLDPLADHVTRVSPQLRSIGRQAVDELECLRPYTPSIFSFFSTWGDFFAWDDGKDKLIRAQVQNYVPAAGNGVPYDSATAARLFPGLKFGFPRPPGTNADQPWFLPECGAGPDALDPAKDPEARPYREIFQIPSAKTMLGSRGR